MTAPLAKPVFRAVPLKNRRVALFLRRRDGLLHVSLFIGQRLFDAWIVAADDFGERGMLWSYAEGMG
jgi:hypothetical protein